MQNYLITSREFYTDIPEIYSSLLYKQIKTHMPTYALYRDKSNPNYDTQAEYHVRVCSQFENLKSFIHQKVDLAVLLGANGVHLTSTQFNKVSYAKELGLEVIVSTHTHDEVLYAQKLGADAVSYSPIFSSPNKSNPKGLADLKNLIAKTDIKIFALGGIVKSKQVQQVKECGAYGFASIRYFY